MSSEKKENEQKTNIDAKLRQYVVENSTNLGNHILKCNSYLNHQVQPVFIDLACQQLYTRLIEKNNLSNKATKILTAPVSGVIPAYILAAKLEIPMVYARHSAPITFSDQHPVHESSYKSHTKKNAKEKKLIVSGEYLTKNDKILIIDDVLASGTTVVSMLNLCKQAQCTVIGAGFIIEKEFENGRKKIADYTKNDDNKCQAFPIESAVIVENMDVKKDGKYLLKQLK